LDYHTLSSEFLGYDEFGRAVFDTKRSDIGELLYRLKYRSDKTVLDWIVATALKFIASWKPNISVIVPAPPSKTRLFQPVMEISKTLSSQLGIPCCEDCIVKSQATPELKNIYDYNERIKLLEAAYTISKSMKGTSILLFDDLYRSGATLNAITETLYDKGQATHVYALALTRTRSIS
jgi:predicted amidophosphoribosyltransferase